MSIDLLLQTFGRSVAAPGAVLRLRRFILDLAVRGQLIEQCATDSSAAMLIEQVASMRKEMSLPSRYRQMVDAPVIEPPFEVPPLWVWTRLGRVADYIQRGKAPAYSSGDGPPVVSQKCVRWEGLDLTPARKIQPDSLRHYEQVRFIRDGDLLWNSTGTGTIGRVSLVSSPPANLVCDGHVTVVRCPRLIPEFVRCWLRSDYVYGQIEDSASGSTNQVELTMQMALSQILPVPPLVEQERIVTRVNELMTLCDDLVATQEEQESWRDALRKASLQRLAAAETVEAGVDDVRFFLHQAPRLITKPNHVTALRQTIRDLAIRGRLVPQDGVAGDGGNGADTTLGEVVTSLHYGTSSKCSYDRTAFPVLRIPNVVEGRVSLEDIKYGQLATREANDLRLVEGDILIVRSNGSLGLVGRPALVDSNAAGYYYAGYLVRARPDLRYIVPQYLVLAFQSPVVRNQIEGPIRTTVGLKNINSTELRRLHFRLPDLDEQHRIVAKMHELMTVCDELEVALSSSQINRARLLDALLHDTLNETAVPVAIDDAIVGAST